MTQKNEPSYYGIYRVSLWRRSFSYFSPDLNGFYDIDVNISAGQRL